MTNEEILQLVIHKLTNLENEMKEMRGEMKEMRSEVRRLETKIDANHAEMLDRFVNLHVDIMAVNGKLERTIVEQQHHRRTTQTAIAELQTYYSGLELEVKIIKDKVYREV